MSPLAFMIPICPSLRSVIAMGGLLAAAASAPAITLNPAVERELTSATGEKIKARIVEVTETQVGIVRQDDQATFVFPIERLSAEDRGFVTALYEMKKVAPTLRSTPGSTREATIIAGDNNARLPTPRPSFSRALSMLAQEREPAPLREALEVVIDSWPKQRARSFPVHYVSHNVWQALRRLPEKKESEQWINGLLTAKVNDASLTQEQRDGYVFMSLTRNTGALFTPAWREALNEFARVRPDSALLPVMEVGYAAARYRESAEAGKRHATSLLSSPNRAIAEAAREQLAEWAEVEALGPIHQWRFTAIDGSEVDIGRMRGKVVLIDFWATWCGPCIKELPALKKLHADYHGRGLEIVGIALEHQQTTPEAAFDKLRAFVKQHDMAWPHYADAKGWKTRYAAAQKVGAIPRVILIDRSGQVIDERLRGDALAERVARLIEEPAR